MKGNDILILVLVAAGAYILFNQAPPANVPAGTLPAPTGSPTFPANAIIGGVAAQVQSNPARFTGLQGIGTAPPPPILR